MKNMTRSTAFFFNAVDDASDILRKRDDDLIAEQSDCLLKYLAVAIDLITDIGIRYSDTQDGERPGFGFSEKLDLGHADLPLLETLLEQVTSSNRNLQTKREEPNVNRLVTYLNGSCTDVRLIAYSGPEPEIHNLIKGVTEANYADEEDLDDAESLCSFLVGILEFISRVESVRDSDSEEGENSEEEENWSDVDAEEETASVGSRERAVGLDDRTPYTAPVAHSHHANSPNPADSSGRLGQSGHIFAVSVIFCPQSSYWPSKQTQCRNAHSGPLIQTPSRAQKIDNQDSRCNQRKPGMLGLQMPLISSCLITLCRLPTYIGSSR